MDIAGYIRDPRILYNKKGEFRSNLCLEHIRGYQGSIEEIDFGDFKEPILRFVPPLTIPYMQFYPSGITSPKDKYLRELVEFYMHINPNIDRLGIKKMTEFIVRSKVRKDSEGRPVLTFEQLEDVVWNISTAVKGKILPKDRNVHVLYSKDSRMEMQEKRQFSFMASAAYTSRLKGDIIHEAVVNALDLTHHQIIVNNPKVFAYVDQDLVKSTRTMVNNMQAKSVDLLERGNNGRLFLTEYALDKFQKFLALPGGTSMDDAAKKLKASKSTILEYSKFKKELNL